MELLGCLADLFPSRAPDSRSSSASNFRSYKRLQPSSAGPASRDPCGIDFFTCLPDDLIYSITDFLSSPTCAVLKRVCKRFHGIVKPKGPLHLSRLYALHNNHNLTWTGLEYLHCIAKDDPSQFVCEKCLRVDRLRGFTKHVDCVTDPICKAGWRKSFPLSTRMGHAALMKNFYMIQLCLKWKRFESEGELSDEYRRRYDHLMKSRKATYQHVATDFVPAGIWLRYEGEDKESPELATDARIHQGRFLLRTTWNYPLVRDVKTPAKKCDNPGDQTHHDKMKLLSMNIGDVQICPHQAHLLWARGIGPHLSGSSRLNAIDPSWLRRNFPRIGEALNLGIWSSDQVSRRAINRGLTNLFQIYESLSTLTQKLAFQRSVKRASRNYNTPIYGSCTSCPTDWRVEYAFDEAKGLEMSFVVWQDLGSEGSPLNEGWRCQVANLGAEETEKAKILRQSAGSVKKLWDPTPFKVHFCD